MSVLRSSLSRTRLQLGFEIIIVNGSRWYLSRIIHWQIRLGASDLQNSRDVVRVGWNQNETAMLTLRRLMIGKRADNWTGFENAFLRFGALEESDGYQFLFVCQRKDSENLNRAHHLPFL